MPIPSIHRTSVSAGLTRVGAGGADTPTAPVRNRYFFGKLLDVRHLEMEQRYFIDHRRRINRYAIGAGVVAGLRVRLAPGGAGVEVSAGFALDGRGREIVVTEANVVDPTQLTDRCGQPAGEAKDTTVTIAVAYHECDSDPSPVLVDDCDLRERCVAGAVRERYRLLVLDGDVPDEAVALATVRVPLKDAGDIDLGDRDVVASNERLRAELEELRKELRELAEKIGD